MPNAYAFKSDTSFLEKISMGAIGTQRVFDDLRQQGHHPIELGVFKMSYGGRYLEHEAAKVHEKREARSTRNRHAPASWSSRFVNFAPLRALVFQTPRGATHFEHTRLN